MLKTDPNTFELNKPKKIKIVPNLRVLVLSITCKNTNIHGNSIKVPYILKYENVASKKSWNAVKMTSNSKYYSHVANPVAGIWVLTACHHSKLLKINPFLFMSVLTLKKRKIEIEKQIHIYLNLINPKIKIIQDFSVFILSLIPKNKNWKIT